MLLAMPFAYVGLTAAGRRCTSPPSSWREILVFLNTGPANAVFVNVALPEIRATGIAMSIFVYHLLGDVPSPILIGQASEWTGSLQTALSAHAGRHGRLRRVLPRRASVARAGTPRACRRSLAAREARHASGLHDAHRGPLPRSSSPTTASARRTSRLPGRRSWPRTIRPTSIPCCSRCRCGGPSASWPGTRCSGCPCSAPDPRLRRLPRGHARGARGARPTSRAKALVLAGEVVGIFPEGKRSRTGWMEPTLREGAARLAWETGAPLVPATIAGAYRAWPYFQSLPRPARIRVRFHAPIDPAPYRGLPEEEALPAMLAELRRRVDRSLLPGVKADLRMIVLYALPAPPPRVPRGGGRPRGGGVLGVLHGPRWSSARRRPRVPGLPACWTGSSFPSRAWPSGSATRRPSLFLPGRRARSVLAALGVPPGRRPARALAAVLARRAASRTSTSAAAMAMASCAAWSWPSLLELGGAVAGAQRRRAPRRPAAVSRRPARLATRTVFWRYAAPLLLAYAVGRGLLLGGGPGLLPTPRPARWPGVRPRRFRMISGRGAPGAATLRPGPCAPTAYRVTPDAHEHRAGAAARRTRRYGPEPRRRPAEPAAGRPSFRSAGSSTVAAPRPRRTAHHRPIRGGR